MLSQHRGMRMNVEPMIGGLPPVSGVDSKVKELLGMQVTCQYFSVSGHIHKPPADLLRSFILILVTC